MWASCGHDRDRPPRSAACPRARRCARDPAHRPDIEFRGPKFQPPLELRARGERLGQLEVPAERLERVLPCPDCIGLANSDRAPSMASCMRPEISRPSPQSPPPMTLPTLPEPSRGPSVRSAKKDRAYASAISSAQPLSSSTGRGRPSDRRRRKAAARALADWRSTCPKDVDGREHPRLAISGSLYNEGAAGTEFENPQTSAPKPASQSVSHRLWSRYVPVTRTRRPRPEVGVQAHVRQGARPDSHSSCMTLRSRRVSMASQKSR